MQALGIFLQKNARWLLGGFILTLFSSFGQTFFISLSNANIRAEFGLSHGQFGGIYMLATVGSALTLPAMGRLLDRYRPVTVGCLTIVMLALATIAMSVSMSVAMLVVSLYLLRLFGQGMMTQTAYTATGRWFELNRGRAMSFVSLGQQAGEAVLPFLFVLLAGAVGWRVSWQAGAASLVLIALPLTLLLINRERRPAHDPLPVERVSIPQWTLAQVLGSPHFYGICLGVLAPSFIATSIFFHQVYLTELRGWPLTLFASAFPVMSAATVVFALLTGWLIDRFSARHVLPAFLLPLAAGCLILAFATASWAIFVFMLLMGVSNGFSSTLLGALWPEIYGTRHLGSIRSVIVALMVLSSAVGPGLTGYLIDAGVDFDLQLAAMGAYCVGAAVIMALVSRRLGYENATAGVSSRSSGAP